MEVPDSLAMRVARWPWRFVRAISIDQWRAIDREAAAERAPGEAGTFSWNVIVVLAVTAVFFLGLYVGKRNASFHAPADDRVARVPVGSLSAQPQRAEP